MDHERIQIEKEYHQKKGNDIVYVWIIEDYIIVFIIFILGSTPVWIISYIGIRLDRKEEAEKERLKKLVTPNDKAKKAMKEQGMTFCLLCDTERIDNKCPTCERWKK